MLRTIVAAAALAPAICVCAQQKEGRVIYQRTMEMNITMRGNPEMVNALPKTRTNSFELNFSGNTASWKQLQEIQPDENNGGGLIIQFAGGDDLVWYDLARSRRLQQTELAGKNYLVSDSIRTGNWKITDETKTILGHSCRKAISTVVATRMITGIDNGKMERKEISDTTQSVAWFTTDIPVPAGPDLQGQLPGLVLELSARSGRVLYTALEISPKPDNSALKEPTKGKKMAAADFAKERTKIFEQMQENSGGQNGTMRFSVTQ